MNVTASYSSDSLQQLTNSIVIQLTHQFQISWYSSLEDTRFHSGDHRMKASAIQKRFTRCSPRWLGRCTLLVLYEKLTALPDNTTKRLIVHLFYSTGEFFYSLSRLQKVNEVEMKSVKVTIKTSEERNLYIL
ncbi:hypothetical protein ABKN59_002154 [Abortiporus biennis]